MYGNEPAKGWAMSGELNAPGGVNGGSKVVKLQANLIEEGSVTTQFNLNAQGPVNAVAEIVSSLHGNSIKRLVSVVDGASITTRGKTISVTVKDYTAPEVSAGMTYTVSIASTLGVRAGSKQPPLLFPLVYKTDSNGPLLPVVGVVGVPAAGKVFFPLPQDAGIIAVYINSSDVRDAGSPGALVRVFQDDGSGFLSISSYDLANKSDWVPLAPNVGAVIIENHLGIPILVNVFFGVDG